MTAYLEPKVPSSEILRCINIDTPFSFDPSTVNPAADREIVRETAATGTKRSSVKQEIHIRWTSKTNSRNSVFCPELLRWFRDDTRARGNSE